MCPLSIIIIIIIFFVKGSLEIVILRKIGGFCKENGQILLLLRGVRRS